jgi:hypothetical protein
MPYITGLAGGATGYFTDNTGAPGCGWPPILYDCRGVDRCAAST